MYLDFKMMFICKKKYFFGDYYIECFVRNVLNNICISKEYDCFILG